jgi:hypothetical protein
MPTITIDNIKDWPPEKFEVALREAMDSTSPVDAIIAIVERLTRYEEKFGMKTPEFYEKFMRGEMGDAKDYIAWAGTYEILLRQKRRLEVTLMNAALQWQAEAAVA